MIELSQLQIPNYKPLRTVEVEHLRANALHQLETNKVVPITEPKSLARDFLDNVIEGLCEILLDETCNDSRRIKTKVNQMMNAFGPICHDDIATLVHQLHYNDGKPLIPEGEHWGIGYFSSAYVQKMWEIVEFLLDSYCQTLDDDFQRLNESKLYLQRDQIREAIQAELVDFLSERARMNADEAAVWILSNVLGQQANIALVLLKNGRTLEEAVEVAKTFTSEERP